MNLSEIRGSTSQLTKLRPSLLLTLVRHGQSEGNKQGVIQGQSDYPLSELGVQQAQTLRAHLDSRGVSFDAVYSSDLSRARQTADIVAAGLEITNDRRLRERNYGKCENKPAADLARAAAAADLPVAQYVPDGGESQEQVRDRAGEFFKEICARHLSDTCTRILVTGHGGCLRELITFLFSTYSGNLKKADAHKIAPNTGVTVVHVARKGQDMDSLTLKFLKIHSDEHLVNVASTAPPEV
ncbi:Fructose-2,6-bisphosphatase TIGAR [Amphibalanus amphitrite]|uniref:Fructose-2,6-bisphosphatase TIGAR n=1 Tax=Amphibalanus amphitrite TaxID=1232801 RepID=A0A6A4VLR7_AMPAM|nr:Fructose-2,6-bisphosphatase TIGAR [Amphibalanus amphitrite]